MEKNYMYTVVESITPEIASHYLKSNIPGNRKIRPAAIKTIMDLMRRGQWTLTHQGIAFDVNGNLIDGQHRLLAVGGSGCTVLMSVTRNAPADSFQCVDIGSKRSIADVLQLDKRVVEPCNYLARLLTHSNLKVSPDMTLDVYRNIGCLLEELLNHCGTTTAYFTSGPAKVSAVMRMTNVLNKPYVLSLYRNLALAETTRLPPVASALVKQVLQKKITIKNHYDALARTWVVFDETKKNISKIQIGDNNAAPGEIRDLYILKFGRHNWMTRTELQ